MRTRPDPSLEGYFRPTGIEQVTGVDEVSVGAWAGRVIVGAVILLPEHPIEGLNDSKLLSAKRREAVFALICRRVECIGVGRAQVAEIDRLNVYWAAMLARRRAVEALGAKPDHVLVDGKRRIADLEVAQTPIIEGDRKLPSIAAASVVAKVIRDRLMRECGEHYWGYGFERHKGYGTEQHRAALTTAGPLPIHRCSFAPVAALADKQLPFALGGMVARTRHALKSARADGGRRGQIWALFAD